jgi:hypothetical protein
VTTIFEDNMGSDAGGADFEHVLFEDEVLTPELFDVGLDGATDWAKVVETGTTTVDLTTLEEDKTSLDEVVE